MATFKETGIGSKCWYLSQIKNHPDQKGVNYLTNAPGIYWPEANAAIGSLLVNGYLKVVGKEDAKSKQYKLTSFGHRYLEENKATELADTADDIPTADKKPSSNLIKEKTDGNGIVWAMYSTSVGNRFRKNGKLVSRAAVPIVVLNYLEGKVIEKGGPKFEVFDAAKEAEKRREAAKTTSDSPLIKKPFAVTDKPSFGMTFREEVATKNDTAPLDLRKHDEEPVLEITDDEEPTYSAGLPANAAPLDIPDNFLRDNDSKMFEPVPGGKKLDPIEAEALRQHNVILPGLSQEEKLQRDMDSEKMRQDIARALGEDAAVDKRARIKTVRDIVAEILIERFAKEITAEDILSYMERRL